MNPELQGKLVAYLDALERGAQKVGEFAADEVPQTIREWLVWLAVERFGIAAVLLIVCALLLTAGRWLARKFAAMEQEERQRVAAKQPADRSWRDESWANSLWGWSVVMRITQGLSVIPFLISFYWTFQGVKVLVAPRVVLVEEVSKLVTGSKPK